MNQVRSSVLRIRGYCGAGEASLAKIPAFELVAKTFAIGRYRQQGRDEVNSWERMPGDRLQHLEAGGRYLEATTCINNNEFVVDRMPTTE